MTPQERLAALERLQTLERQRQQHLLDSHPHKDTPVEAAPDEYSPLASAGMKPEFSDDPTKTSPYQDAKAHDYEAALASGVAGMGAKVANFVLPKSLQPSGTTNEDIQAREQRDQPLPAIPRLIGEQAVLAPLSGPSAALARTTGALGPLARTLARGTIATGEGATAGAIAGDPDNRGRDAAIGAALGLPLSVLGSLGGRGTRGLVPKSPEAQRLEEATGVQLPVANAADTDTTAGALASTFYRHGLPNIPGAGGMLKGQQEDVAEEIRQFLANKAKPPGSSVELVGPQSDQMAQLRADFDRHYDDLVNHKVFNIPPQFDQLVKDRISASMTPEELASGNKVPQIIQEKLAALLGGHVAAMSDGGAQIGGRNLMDARQLMAAERPNLNIAEQKRLPAALDSIDEMVQAQLGQKAANTWDQTKEPYSIFKALNAASDKANKNQGRYTFGQLLDSSDNAPAVHDIAELATPAMDQRGVNPNWGGRFLVSAAGGAALLHGGAGIVPTLAASTALASRPMQNALLGNTGWQQRLAQALRTDPEAMKALGGIMRNTADTEAVQ